MKEDQTDGIRHWMNDPVRKALKKLITDRKLDLSQLSKAIGKNHAYLQQYFSRGVPRDLPEKVRGKLAELLDVDERVLGAIAKAAGMAVDDGSLAIVQHDVRASAGNGAVIEEEPEVGRWQLPKAYVRHSMAVRSSNLALISVIGDSMEPTLEGGDIIMVDLNDKEVAQPGIFALYQGDTTVVKRLELVLGSEPQKVRVICDNPRQGTYDVLADVVNVAGRVVWFGRRM